MLRMVELLDYFRMLNNVHAIFITASLFYKMSSMKVSEHYSNQESCDKMFQISDTMLALRNRRLCSDNKVTILLFAGSNDILICNDPSIIDLLISL